MDRKFYANEREIDLAEQKDIHKRGKQIIIGRTIIFILMTACLIAGYEGFPYCYESALIFFLIFFTMVRYHEQLRRRSAFLKSRLAVHNLACRRNLEEEIKRRQHLSQEQQAAGRGSIHLWRRIYFSIHLRGEDETRQRSTCRGTLTYTAGRFFSSEIPSKRGFGTFDKTAPFPRP